jgi:hypothetical protein
MHLLRKNLHNIRQNLSRGAVLGKSQLVLVVLQVNSVTQRATQFVVRRVHRNGINIKRETTCRCTSPNDPLGFLVVIR